MKFEIHLNNNNFNKGLLLAVLLSIVPTVVGAVAKAEILSLKLSINRSKGKRRIS